MTDPFDPRSAVGPAARRDVPVTGASSRPAAQAAHEEYLRRAAGRR